MALEDIDVLKAVPVEGDYQVTFHNQISAGMKSLKTLEQSTDTSSIKKATAQTIAGVKTFNSSPIVPTTTTATRAINKDGVDDAIATTEPAITAGTILQYYRGDKTWQTLDKTAAGLGNVSNIADASKPVSTAMQTALNSKQDYIDGSATPSGYLRGDKTFQVLDATAVGLANVQNTSDLDKVISTAQQEGLDLKQDSIGTGELFQYLRGGLTWVTLNSTAVGLGNVNNVSDANKPISGPQQTALDGKATTSLSLLLSGTQTVDGVKTFSSSPKWGTATVGHVWKATSTDGSGSWQDIGALTTTVDWDGVTSKPSTFDPIIGTTADTAAAGNHTHTKADIGLSDADNTADADKPVSTATQTALNTKVATSRAINTSAHISGGGVLSADRTVAIQTGGIGLADLEDAAKTFGIAFVQTLDTRVVGLGQMDDGITFETAVTITSVQYRLGTADASGTTTVELRKNGIAVSGTSTTAALSPTPVTGTWTFAAGDKLTVYITAIGTTPGKRLTADIIAKLG